MDLAELVKAGPTAGVTVVYGCLSICGILIILEGGGRATGGGGRSR
jgi:hypothetical protein